MKSLTTKTAKLVGTTMLLVVVSPLLPVIGLMYLVAIACDKKVESKTATDTNVTGQTFSLTQSTTYPCGQYIMSH